MGKRYKYYRIGLLVWLFGAIIVFGVLVWKYVEYEIPQRLQVHSTEYEELDTVFENPFITWEATVETSSANSYEAVCYLFGVIPLKTVEVTMAEVESVYASGTTIGIYMETNGVLVIDSGTLTDESGNQCSPAKNLVCPGDYIYKVNGHPLEGKEDLIDLVDQGNGADMELEILRDEEWIQQVLTPILTEDGTYKLGIWVRDDMQGIGTLTYVDMDHRFGALGHGIKDNDLGELLEIDSGRLYMADVLSIQKGVCGTPGEINGIINYKKSNRIGTIETNSETGINGVMEDITQEPFAMKLYPVGLKQEVELGPATILCGEGKQVEEYEIEIVDVTLNSKEYKKGIKLKVTDERLLEMTGGIVQGMSGSPILQSGRIVGAVTHVLVNDPTRGYGIFIENMLDAAG